MSTDFVSYRFVWKSTGIDLLLGLYVTNKNNTFIFANHCHLDTPTFRKVMQAMDEFTEKITRIMTNNKKKERWIGNNNKKQKLAFYCCV
jgi:uncharacterized protein YdcH (DUF465 family)